MPPWWSERVLERPPPIPVPWHHHQREGRRQGLPYRGSIGAIRALLAAGALRNARNAYGATALDIAMREGRDNAADALRDA